MIRVYLLIVLFLWPLPAFAQNAITLPIAANAVADLGNGPVKVRMVAGNASIFTSQGSGFGSTSGSSTALTLTTTPATAPIVGGLISGGGITSGTTVTAYNGTTGITLSAAMTVPGGTTVAWGAACPSTPPSNVIQASPMAGYYVMYTQARVCAVSPGGPVNTLLVEPIFYDQTTPNGNGGVSFANPSANAGPTAVNGSASTAMRSDSAPAVPVLGSGGANQIPVYPGSGGQFVPTAISSFFDAVCSSTIGQSWVRLTGGWGCLSLGYANPVWWGAVGNGSTNNDSAFSSALAAAASTGMIVITQGTYCVFSGIAITQNYFTMQGRGAVVIDVCNHNVTAITLGNGTTVQRVRIADLIVNGYNNVTPGVAAIILNACVACRLDRIDAQYGLNVLLIENNSTYTLFESGFSEGYGTANVEVLSSGGWCIRTSFDQNWPTTIPTPPATINNWAATTVIATGAIVQVTSGVNWWFQATVGGTTGSTSPTVLPYNTNIIDGSVTWRLMGQSALDGVRYDSGTSQAFEWGCDHSGPLRYGINMLNSLGTTAPQLVSATDTAFGTVAGLVRMDSGNGLQLENNQMGSCVQAGCAGILIDGGTAIVIHGNYLLGNQTGILVDSGAKVNMIATNNLILSSAINAVNIGSGVTNYIVNSNLFGTAAGSCTGVILNNGSTPNAVQANCP